MKSIKLSKVHALSMAIIISLIAMFIEFYYAKITHSVMLFSDGIHMLSHVASLLVSLIAIYIGVKRENEDHYNHVAAFINGLGLLLFSFFIFKEAYDQFTHSSLNEFNTALYTAIFGLIVNLATALILSLSGVEDINTKSAFMHMLADTFSSVSIIIGLIVIHYTGWLWIDALLSIIVGIVICKWAIGLLKESIYLIPRMLKQP